MHSHETMTAQDLANRYRVTLRTIQLWIAKRYLPPRCKMPGQTPFWYVYVIDEWERDRGLSPLSALWAKAYGGSPCFPKIETITLEQLAERWRVMPETIRRWSAFAVFPQPLKTQSGVAPSRDDRSGEAGAPLRAGREEVEVRAVDDKPALVFSIDAVMSLERAHGSHSAFCAVIQEDEMECVIEENCEWNEPVPDPSEVEE